VASEPDVLLLDEPMSALDPATKARVSDELARRLRELRLPTVLVAHDFADVVGLADRIAVIEAGSVVQRGTARELLEAPVSSFVASLAGVNYFTGVASRRGDLTEIRPSTGPGTFVSVDSAAGPVGVVVPPWEVALSAAWPDGSALNSLHGPVSRVVALGTRVRVTLATEPPIVAEITDHSATRLGVAQGIRLVASWKATGTRLVPAARP
jgi:molybdate transport system ATP-binding protein